MGVSYANHHPADVAVPGPVAPRIPVPAGPGTQQPVNDGPGASRTSPVTPDLLRTLLRSLSQLH